MEFYCMVVRQYVWVFHVVIIRVVRTRIQIQLLCVEIALQFRKKHTIFV